MDRLKRSRVLRAFTVPAVLVAGVLTLVSLARRTSLAEVGAALTSANLWDLVLYGMPALGVGFAFRAARFRKLLRDDRGHHPPMQQVLAAVILSQAANNLLPFRAGELIRTREFTMRSYPLVRVGVAQVVEKGIELASMLMVVAAGVALGMLGRASLVWLAGAAAGLCLVGVVCIRLRPVRAWIGRATSWSSADLAISLVWAILADAAEIALVSVSLRALGLGAGFRVSVAVFAAVNIAIALPGTPGHFGALEAGAAAALAAMGTPSERSLAFAVLYRVVQWVPLMLAGGAIAVGRRSPSVSPAPLEEAEFPGGKAV